MGNSTTLLIRVTLLLGLPISVQAAWYGAEFSAQAVQTAPKTTASVGMMYVGKGRVRTEFQRDGRRRVEIISPDTKHIYMLLPDQKGYFENPLPPSYIGVGTQQRSSTPCDGFRQLHCTAVGNETINGREAEKWQVTGDVQGKIVESMQWLDKEHRFPIRQELGGKVVFELDYQGKAEVNGRETEKWQSVSLDREGKQRHTTQWYDPQLNIAIRQELPGGIVRELRDIKVAPQPDRLFSVPTQYRRLQLPTATSSDDGHS